ncbi:MAG: hypothetical protein ACK4QL_05465 [Pseudanabaenaceae cyanobacterium]
MTIEEALNIVDIALAGKSLSTVQELIFRYTWEGKTYLEIADLAGYDSAYIRDVGYKLWQMLSKAFGERVTKNNLQVVLRRYAARLQGKGQLAHLTNPDFSNGISHVLGQIARLLNEPNSNYSLYHSTDEESGIQLTITLRLGMAE